MAAYTHRSYADILSEHYNMRIIENIQTQQHVLVGKDNNGKQYMMGIDKLGLAASQNPQGILASAAAGLQAQINQANALNQAQYAQAAMYQQQAQNFAHQSNYLNQLAQNSRAAEAYRAYSGEWPEIVEEVEEKVVKEVYKAAFDMHRFFEKLMHLPIALIDRMATPCGV